ncbi:MAG: SGNH/GDSL hydrolase family protein [Chthoniobacterales bacterium]
MPSHGDRASFAGLVEQLARAGAYHILVPNVPPLGLVPNYQDDIPKAALLNAGSAEYRQEFNIPLDAARGDHDRPLSLRYFRTLLPLGANPEDVGFVNISDVSQAQAVDLDQCLFWDDIHPTTAGHYQIASAAFDLLREG